MIDWTAVAVVIALLGLLGTIAGLVFALGKRDARLDVLESRAKEDREKNSDQHKEFYAMRDTVSAISARFDSIEKRLDKLEEGIMEILRLLPKREREH